MKKELGKLETITILILSISIFIYEICFCNFKAILTYKTYNFSLYRIIMYIIFAILYKKFSYKFISEAEKTLSNKKKIIYTYIVLTIIFTIYKLIFEKNYYVLSLIILAELNGFLFVLYITKDYIKNIIVTILTLGFMFSISTNIYNVVDEKKHFISTLNVAVGNFSLTNSLTNKDFNNVDFNCLSVNFAMEYFSKYIDLDMEAISEDESVYSTPSGYTPILYIPASIGINIARLFNGSMADMFFAGRMTNLIAFGILLIILFKILPFKKDTIYAIYMLPINLVLASYYSVDGIIIGLIGIFIAYIFKILKENKDTIDIKDFLIIVGVYLLILICKKGVYLAIGLMVFILPIFKTLKENIKIRCITISIILITIAIGLVQVCKLTENRDVRVEKSNPTKQIEFLLEEPTNIIKVYSNFFRLSIFRLKFYEDLNKYDFFGKYAPITTFMLFIFILYTALLDNSYTFRKKHKIIQYISFFLVFIISSFALYITYTDVGKLYVKGYQARYLTPILPLILVNINSKRVIQDTEDKYNKTAITGGFLSILNLIFMIV